MLHRVAEHGARSAVMVASHNEQSVRLAARLMSQLGLPRDDGRVLFGQTYGVYEQVSTPLGGCTLLYPFTAASLLPLHCPEPSRPRCPRARTLTIYRISVTRDDSGERSRRGETADQVPTAAHSPQNRPEPSRRTQNNPTQSVAQPAAT